MTCRAHDIVVHRADGRKISLYSWAAPIDLQGNGKPDAAVWVLEDWSAMQQTEAALRESELRLRAIIEAMVDGVLLQDSAGVVIDCNPGACAILGKTRDQILTRPGLLPDSDCLAADGTPLSPAEHPDRRVLASGQATRGMILGLAGAGGGVR